MIFSILCENTTASNKFVDGGLGMIQYAHNILLKKQVSQVIYYQQLHDMQIMLCVRLVETNWNLLNQTCLILQPRVSIVHTYSLHIIWHVTLI